MICANDIIACLLKRVLVLGGEERLLSGRNLRFDSVKRVLWGKERGGIELSSNQFEPAPENKIFVLCFIWQFLLELFS